MTCNLWQYLVLLEGLGAVATAVGLTQESLRRDRVVAYANAGVALIALSACANLLASIHSSPTLATWLAAAGFAIYAIAILWSWKTFRLFRRRGARRLAS